LSASFFVTCPLQPSFGNSAGAKSAYYYLAAYDSFILCILRRDSALVWAHRVAISLFITTAATAFIAYFNYTLSKATDALQAAAEKQARDTRTSLRIAVRAANATRDQAKVAKDTLVNAERPYIYAFGAYKFRVDVTVVGGYTPFVRYSVANYGKTPGVIEEVLAGISTSSAGVPNDLLHPEGVHWLLRHPVFAPAERRDDLKETLPDGIPTKSSTTDEIIIDVPDEEDLFFRILIRYRGPFSAGHETSACWRLEARNNRFVRLNDLTYNYER
jgi:hypothetical protein